MKNFFTCIFLFLSITVFGQRKDARNDIDDANEQVGKAQNGADAGITYIKKCFVATEMSNIHFYITQAKLDIDGASSAAREARNKAEDAANASHAFNCAEGERDAKAAEDFFQLAYDELDTTYDKINALTDEEDTAKLTALLNAASDNANKGKDFLQKGADLLNKSLNHINDCR